MRYISELIDKNRIWSPVGFTGRDAGKDNEEGDYRKLCREGTALLHDRNRIKTKSRVNLLALGDVGGTVLMGLRLLGEETIGSIGIFDISPAMCRRYEMEMNQIAYPDGRSLPPVEIIDEESLFDCDMFVFCASKGVPPVGAEGDVRMAQLKANRGLVAMYGDKAVRRSFEGIFAVVSDPVDPLCKAALDSGLEAGQVQGYGLGVMNGRALYHARKDDGFAAYIKEGRAFGPHGEDLVIADSVRNYNDDVSRKLTELTVKSNMVIREDGFKPYIAPALSSAAISLTETLKGQWTYSSVYLGAEADGAFLGCRNRRSEEGILIEDLPLDDVLFQRIKTAYDNLRNL